MEHFLAGDTLEHCTHCIFPALRAVLEWHRYQGKLAKIGLATLGRKRRYTLSNWSTSFAERVGSTEYMDWYGQCEKVGGRFGIAGWVVAMMCLVKGFNPERELGFLALETNPPHIRIITEQHDPRFLGILAREAELLNLSVIQKSGSIERTLIIPDLPSVSSADLEVRLPHHTAFYVRVEIPLGYPPEAARDWQKKASELERELRKRLGYKVRKRFRSSSLVKMAEKLKISDNNWSRMDTYNAIDEVYPEDLREDAAQNYGLVDETKKRKSINWKRHYLRKRLLSQDGST